MNSNFNFFELKAANHLPSPSGTALEIIKLLQDEDANVRQLARLVQSDPALSARVLRFANSAALGARRPIANIQDAVAMIGMKAVRNFALGLSLVGDNSQGPCRNFDYATFWAKSLLLAVTIAAVTARERTAMPEEVFSLGLLADIGRLALATAWPDEYSECLAEEDERRLLVLEHKQFAVDHDTLTLLLLDDWGMPTVFIDALKLSHSDGTVENSRADRLSQQMVFARYLSRYCLADDRERSLLLPELQLLGKNLNLDEGGLSVLVDEIMEQWYDWGYIIQIKTSIEDRADPQKADTETVSNSKDEPVQADSSEAAVMEVLIVGDRQSGLLSAVSEQLIACGHRSTIHDEKESVLKRILEQPPQMIIIDCDNEDARQISKKDFDEIGFCIALRNYDFGRSIYLIMLSNCKTEEDLVEAFDAGVDDYMIKPVGLRVLLARIRAGQRILALQENLRNEHEALRKASAALVLANRKFKHLANTDLLTGLPNRRYAMRRLEREWISSLRTHRPFSLLMIDLDHFKAINDKLGHDAGDKVLIHFGGILESNLRASDVACRLGGEEFTVIAPDTDSAAALLLAKRIRAAVEANQPARFELPNLLTASIGVACTINGKPDWRELLNLADKAMYEAKHAGRNNVKLKFG